MCLVIFGWASAAPAQGSPLSTVASWARRTAASTAKSWSPQRLNELRSRLDDIEAGVRSEDVAGRAVLLRELWRVRHSLDLVALLEPRALEQLTGIDSALLRQTIARTRQLAVLLGALPKR